LKALDSGLHFARVERGSFKRLEASPLQGLRRSAVDYMLGRCQDLGRCGGLAAALLLGFSDGCDLDLVDDFVRSGSVHLLALSGMHLNLILSLLAVLARPLPGRRLRALLFIAGTAAYVFIVGPKPSIVRAFLMFLYGAVADFAGRASPAIQALAVSFVGYGLAAPEALLALSGQLSFLAVAGILLLTRAIQRRLRPWIPGPLLPALSVSLAAQAAVAPLLLARMGGIAPIGLAAGLVLSPLTDVMILGSLVYLAASAFGLPTGALALLLNLVYDAVEALVGAAAGFPMLKLFA
jgi:competence protein ComEC